MWNVTRRAADRRALARLGRLRRQPHEQHLGVDAAQQRAVRHGQRRRAERREPERAPSAHAGGSGQRQVLRVRRICTSPTARSATTACCCRFGGSAGRGVDVQCELHAVALLRLARRQRRRHDQRLGPATTSPSDPGFDDGNCTSDRLHNFTMTAGDRVAAVRERRAARRVLGVAAGGQLQGVDRVPGSPSPPAPTARRTGRPGTQRANQILDDPYADQSINPANGGIRFLNPLAFAQPGAGHARHDAAQQHPGSGQQERRHGADAEPSGSANSRASRSAPRRSTRSTGSSGRSRPRRVNSATFGQITYRRSQRPANHPARREVCVLDSCQLSADDQLSALSWTRSALN